MQRKYLLAGFCEDNICLIEQAIKQAGCRHIVFNSPLYSYVMADLQNILFSYALHLQKSPESI